MIQGVALKMRSQARSDVGCVRALNEDGLFTKDALAPDVGLWAVADGMGGHQAGDAASRLVVSHLAAVAPPSSGHGFLQAVEAALGAANGEMRALAAALPSPSMVGSTVVALLAFAGHYACLWAGDSRAYLLRDGRLARLTRDDRVVQPMIEAGVLTPDQARRHWQANVLTRALGAEETPSLSLAEGQMRPGDVFLLCSDGLSDLVGDAELCESLAAPRPCASALVELALARGARDNVTAVVIFADA